MTTAQSGNEDHPSARDSKRMAILAAAAKIFNERGYHQTSMADVATALNVTKPFLYYYLKDKEDILYQCSRIATEQLHAILDEVRAAKVSGWERLQLLFRGYVKVMCTDFGVCLIRSTSPGLMAKESRDALWTGRRRLNREVEMIIAQGIADGSIRSVDPKKLSFAMFGAFNWITYWYRQGGPQMPETIADHYLDFFARGVVAPDNSDERR